MLPRFVKDSERLDVVGDYASTLTLNVTVCKVEWIDDNDASQRIWITYSRPVYSTEGGVLVQGKTKNGVSWLSSVGYRVQSRS